MKTRFFILVLAATTLLAGCAKELNPETAKNVVTITADAENLKTGLGNDLSVTWTDGDKITIKDDAGKTAVFTLSAGAGTSSGTFSCEDCPLKASGSYEAYYPESIASGNMPCQTVNDKTSLAQAAMYAQTVGSLAELQLNFKNIAALLRVNVKTNLKNTALKRIILKSSKGLSGKYSIVNDVAVIDPASVNPLEMICKSATNISSTATAFYFPVPAGTYPDMDITIEGSNGAQQELSAKGSMTFTAGQITTVNLNADKLILDLGFNAGESANSYIVLRKGVCRLNPVKGNSQTSVGTVAGAKIIWTTLNTNTAPAEGKVVSNVSVKDGKILFECDGTEGNAIIAAYADAACSGDPLWSWHIWRLNTLPADQLYASGATFMALNLGALGATKGGKATGLAYQWGRKDPFPLAYGSNAVKTLPDMGEYAVARTDETGTSEWAQAHPNKFITTSTKDWLTTSDNNRWSATKTVNDPCPAGYRIPSLSSWPSTFTYNFITGTSTNGAYYFDAVITGETECWYPAAGDLNIGTGKLGNTNTRSFCWAQDTPGATNASVLRIQSGNTNKTAVDRGYGLLVRCIRETSILPPANQKVAYCENSSVHIAAVRDNTEDWLMDISDLGSEFDVISEVKPADNLSAILVTASGGGAAKIRLSDSETLFKVTTVGQPHSIEILPGGKYVVACAFNDNSISGGGYLRVFDASGTELSKIACESAHNAVWDNSRNVLWASSSTHLNKYSFNGTSLTLENSYALPGLTPHDLFPVYGQDKLWLTTDSYIYTFDAQNCTFEYVKAFNGAKSVSSATDDYSVIVTNWSSDIINLADGKSSVLKSSGGNIYKARWMVNNTFSYGN